MKEIVIVLLCLCVVVLASTGCHVINVADLDFSIRMTVEQIRQGSFTGGRLIFSENGINHLEQGILIPILDTIQGFVPVDGSDKYDFKTIEERYGYYYVVDSSAKSLTLDYLLYNDEGKIIEHEENIIVSEGDILDQRGLSIPNKSTQDLHYKLNYSKMSTRDDEFSRELEDASLLSFPKEIPSEEEQIHFDIEKRYRTVLFRLQKTGTQAFDYQSGVIAAHETHPFLIIESGYYDETITHEDMIKIKDPDMPMIEIGDYILDNSTATARMVTGMAAGDDINGFQIFHTDDIHVQKVLGALRINVEGDLGEILQKYGSEEDKERLKNIFTTRSDYNILDTQATASLWKNDGPVELELDYNIHLGANMNFFTDIAWNRVSASGSFSFDSTADLDLIFQLLGVDPGTEKKGKFITIPIRIPIEKFTFGVTINVVADYESEDNTKQISYETAMKTGNTKLGISFDVGAKLQYIWGIIPFPQAWCDCQEIYAPFVGASFKFENTELKDLKANKINTGVEALFEINLLGAIIFNLNTNLGIGTEFVRSPQLASEWWADVELYGSLEHLKFGIGVPFTSIGYTWDLGTLWTMDPADAHIVSIPLDDLM